MEAARRWSTVRAYSDGLRRDMVAPIGNLHYEKYIPFNPIKIIAEEYTYKKSNQNELIGF
jgi:hypothetical protein